MKKWRFVSNQNSTIVGINDAGIETFTANMHRSLVREIIQNSLDAAKDDNPVRVEFNLFDMPKDKIGDVNNYRDILRRCKESNGNEPDAIKFFSRAEEIVDSKTVKVLRVSDFNTFGLDGSDTCAKGTGWSRLVKETGSSNKGQGSAGSFGIGKSAAFACSDLRTVFYSSMDLKGLKSNFGVARLVSFIDENNEWTTGMGYYSDDTSFKAMNELATFDDKYVRNESGTDIYILGMHTTDDFQNRLIKSVLLDFLVSLVKGRLIVKVQNEHISKDTLLNYISKLNPYESDEIKDLLEYYQLLTSPNPKIKIISLDNNKYGRKYGFNNGECTLYLKEADGLNRKILITRKAGMRIFEQNRINGSIEFTGVLIIDGINMNEAFKRMEVPSHDAWEPGRCRGEEKYYEAIYDDLRRYLREMVKECFGKVTTNSMDAIGANDFLPDTTEDDGEKEKKDEFSTKIKSLDGKEVVPSNDRSKAMDIDDVGGDGDGGSGPGPGPGPEPGPGPHPGPGPGPEPGPNPGPNPNPHNKGNEKEGYRKINVKKRLICTDSKKGVYTLNFIVPSSVSKGALEFTLSGEQNDFVLPVTSAKIISGNPGTSIEVIEDNKIKLQNLNQGDSLKVEVQVGFEGYCMMEVDYYANKK